MDGIETYWIWLVIGLALALLEMLVPGVYLIWLAMAALAIAVEWMSTRSIRAPNTQKTPCTPIQM